MPTDDLMNIEVIYSKSSEYRTFHVSGAYGGPTPNGEIMCSFYIESSIVPDKINLTISNGKVIKEEPIFIEKSQRLERELQCGIIMNPQSAKIIGEWLIKHADEVLTQIQSTGNSDKE